MSQLIRMDQTGHTVLAQWTAEDPLSVEAAVSTFREQLDQGFCAVVSQGEGRAEQVHELPLDAPTVILRRPIAVPELRARPSAHVLFQCVPRLGVIGITLQPLVDFGPLHLRSPAPSVSQDACSGPPWSIASLDCGRAGH